ncbi:MAG: plasmid pRiA4b ORF-3 family protein [Bacteroidales bacterium]|nr:plasmid pRiA4b ORF-3 family protein [Bacteroidales bacterium]
MNYKQVKKSGPFKNVVLQFKIELSEIRPLIWRRIQIPSFYNFWDLHVAIQDSMGWLDYHLHYFEIKGKGKRKTERIGIPDFDLISEDFEIEAGWEIPVMAFFNDLGVTAKYLFDFGDSWWHTILLEGYLLKDDKIRYPICLDGERSCPPEDCGGVSGYYEMLKVLCDPNDEEHEEMKTWVGKKWNADYFDKEKIKFDDPCKRWVNAFLKK